MTATRLPTIFLPHGAGPCFWITFPPPFGPHAFDGLAAYLRSIDPGLPARPAAILIVSGHWEAPRPTVATATSPGMLFDYYGFPPETYELSYPAPGSPVLGARVRALLAAAGIASTEDPARGFDHGVFVPLLMAYPAADIPVLPLSIRADMDPAAHLAIGRALAPLREEGVLIVGSGMSYHNLSDFRDGDSAASETFDAWLTAAVTDPDPVRRDARLTEWARAPAARLAHPREEHLIPLMVAAGAAGGEPGRRAWTDRIGGKRISAFQFG